MANKRSFTVALLALLVAACGVSGGTSSGGVTSPPAQTTTPSYTVASGPVEATVHLGNFNAECAAVTCWLPTQFQTKLVKSESVSLMERPADDPAGGQQGWPMDEQKITVLCATKGSQYTLPSGSSHIDWYRVIVPADKMEPGSRTRAERAPDGVNYQAYVFISVLKLPDGVRAKACS